MSFFEKLIGSLPKKEVGSKESFEKSPQEEVLASREKESSNNLGGGCNETVLIKLRDDGSGIFKPRDGERPFLRSNIETGTYFKRERAAYLVDRFIEFDLVPPTVIREMDGKTGSLQEFIPDAMTYGGMGQQEREAIEQSESIKLFIFDYIIFNSDRHTYNLLVKDKKMHAIDNGLAFGDAYLCFNLEWPWNKPIPLEIIDKLDKFLSSDKEQSILKDLLRELLSPKEVDACLARIKFIGKLIKKRQQIPLGTELKFFPKS